MRGKRLFIAVFAAAVALLGALPAGADGLDDLLGDPALRADPRVQRLAELDRRVTRLLARYRELEREVGRAAIAFVDAARSAEGAQLAVEAARERFDERLRTAYELGPGTAVEAILNAGSFADVALLSEYVARSADADEAILREASTAAVVAISLRSRAEAELAVLSPRLGELRAMLAELDGRLQEALVLAEEAQVEHEWLEQQRQALTEAAARQDGWEDLSTLTWGEDQSPFLSLLGPSGGRTCETPSGLIESGERFEGWATWYGWEFGGQPTAMGAIFDPRLFTAANRWLPMGSFLRVRNGDRCAIVLVNDRGPYGNLERVIDLSQAAGHYLGVGVSWVQAEVLVVAPPA